MYEQNMLIMYMALGVCLLLVQNVAAGLTTRAVDSVQRERQENRGNELQVAAVADVELQLENTFLATWIDSTLKDAQNIMRSKGLNEIQLPPMTSEFSRKILGITFHGKASVFEGVLQGLATVHRTGVLHLKSEASTGDLSATFEVGVDHPTVRAKVVAKFLNLGPSGNITGSFDKIIMKIVVRLTKRDSGLHVELDTFKITKLGDLSLDIEGLGSVLNYVVKKTIQGLGNSLFKRKLIEALEGNIKTVIANDFLKSSTQSTFNFG